MRIIGITGTLGSGKGTVADYLVEQKGYTHYSVREFLEEILVERGLPCDRDQMRVLANELREKYDPAYIIEQLYTKASAAGKNAVIESLRCPGEVMALQGRDGFMLVAVDSSPSVRYERITKRGLSTDSVSYDDFIRQEQAEMANNDPYSQNIAACMQMADVVLVTDGDIAALEALAEEKLFGGGDNQKRIGGGGGAQEENGASVSMDAIVQSPFDLTTLRIHTYDDIRPYIEDLLHRDVVSREDTMAWIRDYDLLQAYIVEDMCWREVNLSRDTENTELQRLYEVFTQEIYPLLQPADDAMNRRIITLPAIEQIAAEDTGYAIWYRGIKSALDLYREENVPLQVQLADLGTKYGQISGAMTIEHDGKMLTLQQAAVYMENPDRAVRKEVYEKISARRMQDAEALDDLLSQMIVLRDQVARNAGYDNFATYSWDASGRFDYTQQHVFDFHAGVREHVTPVVARWWEEKRQKLGIESIRPYDVAVDDSALPALHPFTTGEELLAIGIEVMRDLDPQFGRNIETMRDAGRFDLDSRPGKRPGGYNCSMPVTHYPFIFMNAAGTQRDVETFVHEAGHAMHCFSMQEAGLQLEILKSYPIEFAEVASMSMELVTQGSWQRFYPDAKDLQRAKRACLEDTFQVLTWIAIVDAFQYWLYTNPLHTIADRDAKFSELMHTYQPWLDYSDHQMLLAKRRQAQPHIFECPFYYIEYAIAGLGALGIWQNYMRDPVTALQKYKEGLSLGYTKPLPELFATTGIPFDFGPARLQELAAFCDAMRSAG